MELLQVRQYLVNSRVCMLSMLPAALKPGAFNATIIGLRALTCTRNDVSGTCSPTCAVCSVLAALQQVLSQQFANHGPGRERRMVVSA
jgi:sorbitol-specific phosphotransferase system component IIBC